jgi:hypothetical protein
VHRVVKITLCTDRLIFLEVFGVNHLSTCRAFGPETARHVFFLSA